MKTSIHPAWHDETQVVCACGKAFTIGSTKEEIRVEICKFCHPFYTGEMRFADTEGKVEQFQKKRAKGKDYQVKAAKKKAAKKEPSKDSGPKSLKEMLMGIK